jgi:hypothetical protein
MKKILLIAGIISFSYAYSQNNDFFDIQKYLEKKSENEKKADFEKLFPKLYFTPPGVPGNIEPFRFPNTFQSPSPLGTLSHVLSNGNKVYLLPQDHMPCVVPDMSQYNSIALVKPDIQQYNIPNPAYPPQSKVDPLSPEKLKELQELLNKMSKNSN